MTEIPLSVLQNLQKYNQSHLIQFWDQLNPSSRNSLLEQINNVDLQLIANLFAGKGDDTDWAALADRADSPVAIELDRPHPSLSSAQALKHGESLLRDGKVAMILVAGGQGTRLGFDKPKGMYPVGPISERTLFQILMERVLGLSGYYGKPVPLFIMTSPATHDETIQFLSKNKNFGIPDSLCQVFCQGTMPAVDRQTGSILMSTTGDLFASPDGHGGMLAALVKNSCLEKMNSMGIETIFYGQIDNPLQQVCDPMSIGFHKLLQSEMTTQVVRKSHALQRVGNYVSIDGRSQIIEYSDFPDERVAQMDSNGDLKFWAGSIAVHIFETRFLNRVADQAEGLPFHKAYKKVSFVDDRGDLIEPAEANAIKFERFVFDLLPLAKNALAIEIDPADGFAAVKNAPPAESETVITTQAAMVGQFKRWLGDCGVYVEPGVDVEINPLFAVNQKHLAEKIDEVNSVMEPTYFE